MSENKSEGKKMNAIKLLYYRIMYSTLYRENDEDQDRIFFTIQTALMLSLFLLTPFWFIFRPFADSYIHPIFDKYSIVRPIRRLVLILLSVGPVLIVSWLISKYVIISDKFIDNIANCDKAAKIEKISTRKLYILLGSAIYIGMMYAIFYFWALPLKNKLFS